MNSGTATALTIIATFAASAATTWLLRGWLERRRVVDTPGTRSLHHSATVTGGGAAVAVVMLVLWLALLPAERSPGPALLIPVVALTLVGLLDDIHNISWLRKLILQFVVAVAFVAVAGPFSRLDLFGLIIETPVLNTMITLAWIVALVNIYNFMDGIDGLAAGYGAVCACVLGVWFVLLGAGGLGLFMYGLMAACLGFLIWNWQPARIFLGDAGSMMLGGTLAAVAVIGQRDYDIPLGGFILLFAVFIGDTSYTLVRRALRGAPVWQAHKEHLYQRAVQSGLAHATVTGNILLISAIMTIPATLEMSRAEPRLLWLLASALILLAAMILVKRRETKTR
jgi:Fuc2NAc and GlcNAc transferase